MAVKYELSVDVWPSSARNREEMVMFFLKLIPDNGDPVSVWEWEGPPTLDEVNDRIARHEEFRKHCDTINATMEVTINTVIAAEPPAEPIPVQLELPLDPDPPLELPPTP